jgi:hypothetical protein
MWEWSVGMLLHFEGPADQDRWGPHSTFGVPPTAKPHHVKQISRERSKVTLIIVHKAKVVQWLRRHRLSTNKSVFNRTACKPNSLFLCPLALINLKICPFTTCFIDFSKFVGTFYSVNFATDIPGFAVINLFIIWVKWTLKKWVVFFVQWLVIV